VRVSMFSMQEYQTYDVTCLHMAIYSSRLNTETWVFCLSCVQNKHLTIDYCTDYR